MTLQEIVDEQVSAGLVPGAVALVARSDEVEVGVAGAATIGGEPMRRDTIFRVASITKPIVAAATMVLVERGVLGLDDEVSRWLPELASPLVLRTPSGTLDDVAPATRAITVRHLLTLQGGHGFTPDVESPVGKALVEKLHQGHARPSEWPPPDEWMARLAEIPLVHQPGEGWSYNVGSDVLGVLLARATGSSLGEALADTLFERLGMVNTGFWSHDVDRLASQYRRGDPFELVDPPDGQWSVPPPFEAGAGGLLSTVDDWAAFGRMLLRGGDPVLSAESVRLMTTSHVEGEPDNFFLDGQGWGYGGGVDVRLRDPWNVVGRYGWIGASGTAGYVIPSTGTVVVFLAQVEFGGPEDMTAITAALTYAARS